MRLQFCWYCGAPRDVRPTLSRNFNLLVGISHVLSVIAAPPGRRDRPVPGDLSGTYDFWFEGGAAIHHTGPTRQYDFANGTRAWESTKFGFGIHIRFPDGTEITVQRRFDPPGEDLVLD